MLRASKTTEVPAGNATASAAIEKNELKLFRSIKKVLLVVNIFVAGSIVDGTYSRVSNYRAMSLDEIEKQSGDIALHRQHNNINNLTNHTLFGGLGEAVQLQQEVMRKSVGESAAMKILHSPVAIPDTVPPTDPVVAVVPPLIPQSTLPATNPRDIPATNTLEVPPIIPATNPPVVPPVPPATLPPVIPQESITFSATPLPAPKLWPLPPPNDQLVPNPIPIQNMSVVHYKACCGLGHRLGRMAAAYHATKRIRYRLQPDWDVCGEGDDEVDTYDALFRPENAYELAYVNSTGGNVLIGNEVPGFYSAQNCTPEELATDNEFYQSLMTRYRRKATLDQFTKEHFEGKLALGIHIRAGNGETGDFKYKGRGIDLPAEHYAGNVTNKIISFLAEARAKQPDLPPPVLYIATDTYSYVPLFRSKLAEIMPVVDFEQARVEEGSGVFAGQELKNTDKDTCLENWHAMISDQILLSSTDVVIAPRYSSFSQSMPLSIALNRKEKKVPQGFCEMTKMDQPMVCHENAMNWCTDRKHKLSMKIMKPEVGFEEFLTTMKIPHRRRHLRAVTTTARPDATPNNANRRQI